MFRLSFLCFLIFYSPFLLAKDSIRYFHSGYYPDPKADYFIGLLKLAMEKTKADYGDYQLVEVNNNMVQERLTQALAANQSVDVYWQMTSKNMEHSLGTVYVPLLKGMMSYSIFLIRKGEQLLFPKSQSLAGLKAIPVG